MTNVASTIAPKSDQMNSDDLIGGPRTIKVTRVSLLDGEQPVGINFEGDGGKPFKPCKSMRRVLVQIWGSDGNAYAGRSMTLYRDEDVQFGGMKVGGIRISHMSHIDGQRTLALTATRGNKKPFVVKPLPDTASTSRSSEPDHSIEDARGWLTDAADKGSDALKRLWSTKAMAPFRDALTGELDDFKSTAAKNDRAPEPQGDDDGGSAYDYEGA